MNSANLQYLTGITSVFIAAILWGTTGTAATFAPELSPLAVGAVAMGIGGLLQGVIAIAAIQRQKQQIMAQWPYLLSGALTVAVYPLAFYASMRFSGVAVGTAISIGSAPLFSALIEYYLDGLQLTRKWLCGAVIGILGMILLSLVDSDPQSLRVIDHSTTGILLGLIAGLTYAFYSWSTRRLMLKGISTRAAMGATFSVGGVLLMPVLVVTGAPLMNSWLNAAVGLYMAAVPMFIGYICYGIGLARIRASTAITITLLEPVVAALLAVKLVGEQLTPEGWLGISLIVIGLIIITLPSGCVTLRSTTAQISQR